MESCTGGGILGLTDTIKYALAYDNPLMIYCTRLLVQGAYTLTVEELQNVIKYQVHWIVVHTRTKDRVFNYLNKEHVQEMEQMLTSLSQSSIANLITMHKRLINIGLDYDVDAF